MTLVRRRRSKTRDEWLASLRYNIKDASEALRAAASMHRWDGVIKYARQLQKLEQQLHDAETERPGRARSRQESALHRRFARAGTLLRPAARTSRDPSNKLFIGTFPGGISYADRTRERHGDYLRLAFLPYDTLALEWTKGVRVSPTMREEIQRHARSIQARRGEDYSVSASGQTVRLGRDRRRARA